MKFSTYNDVKAYMTRTLSLSMNKKGVLFTHSKTGTQRFQRKECTVKTFTDMVRNAEMKGDLKGVTAKSKITSDEMIYSSRYGEEGFTVDHVFTLSYDSGKRVSFMVTLMFDDFDDRDIYLPPDSEISPIYKRMSRPRTSGNLGKGKVIGRYL